MQPRILGHDVVVNSGEQSIARDYGILEDNKTAFVYQMGCNFFKLVC
jgi:hypothetical protein